MKPTSTFRLFALLIVLLLPALACNLPGQSEQPQEPPQQNQPVEQPTQPPAPTAPQQTIQALPRPTRAEESAALPKPTIPAPPAHTTRQPQAQIIPQQEQQPVQSGSNEVGEFYIVNDTSELVICYYYMTFSTETEWGPDRLGSEGVVEPGETFTITEVPYGTYDARAEDCDGNLLGEVYGFDFPVNDTFTLYD